MSKAIYKKYELHSRGKKIKLTCYVFVFFGLSHVLFLRVHTSNIYISNAIYEKYELHSWKKIKSTCHLFVFFFGLSHVFFKEAHCNNPLPVCHLLAIHHMVNKQALGYCYDRQGSLPTSSCIFLFVLHHYINKTPIWKHTHHQPESVLSYSLIMYISQSYNIVYIQVCKEGIKFYNNIIFFHILQIICTIYIPPYLSGAPCQMISKRLSDARLTGVW